MRLIRHLIFTVILSFASLSALGQTGSGGAPDPFLLAPVPNGSVVNVNTKAVALRSQTVNTGIRNLVLIVAGQSNATNVAPSVYTPANPLSLDQLNVNDGAIYAAGDPLLGCSLNETLGPGNPFLRLADSFVTAAQFDRVILVCVAIDATSVAHWETGFAANRITVALGRLAAKGIVAGTNVTIAVLWAQGETDNDLGTGQTAYTNSLNNVIAATRATGFTGPWFVAKQSWNGTAVSAAIQAAEAAVVNHPAGVWAGGDADSLTGNACSGSPCRQSPGLLHWTDAGSASIAASFKSKMALFGAPF